MAKTFETDPNEHISPAGYFHAEQDEDNLRKLEALDDFRRGSVDAGLKTMRLNRSDCDLDEAYRLGYAMPPFDSDCPEYFIGGMHAMADALDRAGY